MMDRSQTLSLSERRWIGLNYLYLVLILAAMAFIISAAMFLQYAYGELPCPLCLLQRLAYFGICFGIILSFRSGFSLHHMGYSMLFTIYLLIVSVRQSLLDIVPRPGHQWIGSAILGLHLPVWSIVISLLLLIIYALKLSIIHHADYLKLVYVEQYPRLRKIANLLIGYIIILCAMNLISVFLQCGLHICHTDSYRLLHPITQ